MPIECRIIVVGYGGSTTRELPSNVRTHTIPFFEYSTKTFLPYRPVMSILFSLPLAIFAMLVFIRYRPKCVINNGLILAFYLMPLLKLCRRKLLVSYHGWTEHNVSGMAEKLTVWLGNKLDCIFANSEGSASDLARLIHRERIVVSEHYADPIFFEDVSQELKGVDDLECEGRYVVAFAGRIVEETNVGPLIRSIPEIIAKNANVAFIFCGQGAELVEQIKEYEKEFPKKIYYLGYVPDRYRMRSIYQLADIVWSCGDDTYLTRPAVESLACGTPVIIPDRPNVSRKKSLMDVKVPESLVPEHIGRLVPADDDAAATVIILQHARGEITYDREAIRAFAKTRYSVTNLDNILSAICGELQ